MSLSVNALDRAEVTITPTSDRVSSRSRVRAWAKRGGFAVVDRGLIAGTNFISNLVLARTLGPDEYGVFVATFSALLLCQSLYDAGFSEPALVVGPSDYSANLRGYSLSLLRGHARVSIIASLLLAPAAAVCYWIRGPISANMVLAVMIALPFYLLMGLCRSLCYLALRSDFSMIGGMAYFVVTGGVLEMLFLAGWLTKATAFGAFAAGSCASSACLLAVLRRYCWRTSSRVESVDPVGRHRQYAKWAVPAAVTVWLSSNIHVILLASLIGWKSVGVMKVLDTILLLYLHYNSALSNVWLPMFAARSKSAPALATLAVRVAVFCLSQAILFYVLLATLKVYIMGLLFGSSYVAWASALPLFALTIFPETLSNVLLLMCRAKFRTDIVLKYNVGFSVIFAGVFLLLAKHGIYGMIWARLSASYVIFLLLCLVMLGLKRREPREAAAAVPVHI